jgi:glycosyltransferase involved in cell wall biosynthesis
VSEQTGGMNNPLLAICVPTYNRALNLEKLLSQLAVLKGRHGDQLEICISNNGSTDETRTIIEDFEREWPTKVQHQSTNIGGTLNIIAVAGQMCARWGIWCGDDDEIDALAIETILSFLQTLAPDTWLLVESKDGQGNGQYMRKFEDGEHTPAAFRRALLCSGLDPLGFMGVHVFPRSAVPTIKSLQLLDARPWPHMVGLLRFLTRPGVCVHVLHQAATGQAKGGIKLFWNAGDLVRLHLSKLRLLRRTFVDTNCNYMFMHVLMLSELYSPGKLKLLLLWKLCEHQDFRSNAIMDFREHYRLLGALVFLTWPHHIFVLLLNQIGKQFYKRLFEVSNKTYLRRLYIDQKKKYRSFDGMRRGI